MFDAEEVADLYRLSIRTIRARTADGTLPFVKVGRRALYPAEALAVDVGCQLVPECQARSSDERRTLRRPLLSSLLARSWPPHAEPQIGRGAADISGEPASRLGRLGECALVDIADAV